MPNWNTTQIIQDLTTIVGVEEIISAGTGGDVDTDNLCLKLAGTDGQALFVRGFDDTKYITTPSNVDVIMVELTDGLDSRGGLNSHDFRVARAYIDVRQYFINRGFEVVPTLKAYF